MLLVLLPAWPAFADELPGEAALPEKILFVGNSFTYYNNSLHNHFRALTAASGIVPAESSRARIMTISGGRLPEHAGGFEPVLSGDDWDVVVLQGHSLGPISEETAPAFRDAARAYAGIARERGVRPVFFMTWAYTGKPEMTAALDAAYTDIGRELDAEVVPVGLAFARVTTERPDIELRIDDARHPTVAGTYLAACTFYAALYQQSPEGVHYDAGLAPEVAGYLQRVAWQTVDAYAAREAEWVFGGWSGPPVLVRSYVPLGTDSSSPVVIVMHGASRDAPRYYADWRRYAEAQKFILAVPEFPRSEFPGSASYNLGNMVDAETGERRPRNEWTFAAIEPLFDELLRRTGGGQTSYTLYGHSAGAQFVHRYLYFVPETRATRFIAANAGWYTLPAFEFEWPYGLLDSGLTADALPAILAADLVVLLGDADIDEQDDSLRKTPEADLQGPNRLARGRTFYSVAEAEASLHGLPLNWRLATVEGADHDNAKMAGAAAGYVE